MKKKKILVQYKIKADRVAENETLVRDVYQELEKEKIEGFHYCTLKLDDGATFVHIAFADTEEADTAFGQLPAFKRFQAGITDRCEEQPRVRHLSVIGSFDFAF